MSITPRPGLVIKYDFLWKEESDYGKEHGKNRPCAIIMAQELEKDKGYKVVVCPITHSPPRGDEKAVEIPYKVKEHLKLDADRSWIKTSQVNTFLWKKDMVPFGVTPAFRDQFEFGMMPRGLSKKVFDQVKEQLQNNTLQNVVRQSYPRHLP